MKHMQKFTMLILASLLLSFCSCKEKYRELRFDHGQVCLNNKSRSTSCAELSKNNVLFVNPFKGEIQSIPLAEWNGLLDESRFGSSQLLTANFVEELVRSGKAMVFNTSETQIQFDKNESLSLVGAEGTALSVDLDPTSMVIISKGYLEDEAILSVYIPEECKAEKSIDNYVAGKFLTVDSIQGNRVLLTADQIYPDDPIKVILYDGIVTDVLEPAILEDKFRLSGFKVKQLTSKGQGLPKMIGALSPPLVPMELHPISAPKKPLSKQSLTTDSLNHAYYTLFSDSNWVEYCSFGEGYKWSLCNYTVILKNPDGKPVFAANLLKCDVMLKKDKTGNYSILGKPNCLNRSINGDCIQPNE